MDIYVHILRKMQFGGSDRTFFYVCNGEKTSDKFDNKINFKNYINSISCKYIWIEDKSVETERCFKPG